MCWCCSCSCLTRVMALLSIGVALWLTFTSEKILRAAYSTAEDPKYKLMTGILNTVDKFLTVFGTKIDAGRTLRTFLWMSSASLAIGVVQLLTSVFLLLAASAKSRAPIAVFSFLSSIGFVVITGCLYTTTEYFPIDRKYWSTETPQPVVDWQMAMIIDVVFLIFAIAHSICLMLLDRRRTPAYIVTRTVDGVPHGAVRQA